MTDPLGATALYVAVVVVVMSLGTVTLTTSVARLVPGRWRVQVNTIYTLVTLLFAVAGCALWPATLQVAKNPIAVALSVLTGAILVVPVTKIDSAISRRLAVKVQQQLGRTSSAQRGLPAQRRRVSVTPAGVANQRPGPGASSSGQKTQFQRTRAAGGRFSTLFWLMAVAVAEELFFRGAMVGWAQSLGSEAATIAGYVWLTVAFLLLHSGFGWGQVVAKIPLAVGTLACCLAFQSVWGAIVLHGLFNFWYWRRQSWLASSPVGTVTTS